MTKKVKKRISKIILFAILCQTIFVVYSYGYWEVSFTNPLEIEKNKEISIGFWPLHGAYAYDPNKDYPKNTLVYKDGVYYIADIDVNSGDTYHDPENSVASMWLYMRYRQAAKEYVRINRYFRGDYVIHNGKTYKWNYIWGAHDPNTFREAVPPDSKWELVSNSALENIWFRYNIYSKGEVVDHEGSTYKCIKEPCFEKDPPNSEFWQEI